MEYFETFDWNPDERIIQKAVKILQNNGIGIIPTDSIYAFVCDIHNKKGLEKICKIIGKKPEKANLSIIFRDLKNITDFTIPFDTATYKLIKRNFPGPFTFILKANNSIPRFFPSNRKTIGIRIPDNKITQAIVEHNGHPLIASSVHAEDQIIDYLTDPEEIHNRFQHQVDFIIAAGNGGNVPSTVVDLTEDQPVIIRQGKGELI